jgi:hypothetical protein
LGRLDVLIREDLARLNERLRALGLAPIDVGRLIT